MEQLKRNQILGNSTEQKKFLMGILYVINMCADWSSGPLLANLSPQGHLTKTWFHEFHVIIQIDLDFV